MTEPTPYERLWLGVLDELRESSAIEVQSECNEPVDQMVGDAATAFPRIEEAIGCELDPRLHGCHHRFTALGSYWATTEDLPYIAGEFFIGHLTAAISQDPPEVGSLDPSVDVMQLQSELRTIDGTPESGTGYMAALRIQHGARNPEVWFDYGTYGAMKMDIDYCAYLETLRVTKGTFGWQFLFTDTNMAGTSFERTAQRLRDMLAIFPEIFPQHDYSDLRARLEARL